MIAEPNLLSRSVQKENSVVDVSSCASVHHVTSERNENRQKTVRGKRKARECSENAKRKHSKCSNGSLGRAENEQLKNGDVEAVTLFEVVSMGRSAMQAVVDDWIDAYTGDRDTALLDLISFFIQCSGCKGMVTAEMFQSKKGTDVMSKMVEDLDEDTGLQYKKFLAFPWILTVTWPLDMDGGEYPLIMSGLYWKRFRSHFCEFVSVLVAQCQNCVIFDGYLLNTLISLLTELSDSRVRAFRHTCTLAAVKLLSALVNVALNLSVSVDNSQRLYEVELAKMASKRASPRLDRIQRKISELQERKFEIENMMDAIFKGVFLKRYRDVIPEIRAICMEELTMWMKLYSSVFLNDSYLKYVGWMMHDKQPDVRLKCVLGLQGLYQDQSCSKMDLFTIRFKERIISMTLDKDHEVAIQAMRLLMVISQSCEDVLSPDEHKNFFQFVYCSHRPLATTAGEFLYNRLLGNPELSRPRDGASEQERDRELVLARVRALIHFHTESELHQHVLYLVDSLWDSAGALLKDWNGLTSLLLPHTSCQEQALSSAEEAFVIELLLASVKQAAEGPPLSGRGAGKKVINTKEKKLQIDDCTKLTEHFIKVLPELLSKYSEDAEKLTSLLKIPQYFQTDTCDHENSQCVQALLAELEAAVDRHTDAGLLETAARSYQSLCAQDSPWHSLAQPSFDRLIQHWTDTLGTRFGESQSDGCFTANEDSTLEILSTLKKLNAVNIAQDLSKWSLYELGTRLLDVEIKHGGLPMEVTVEALRFMCNCVLWKLNTFGEGVTSRDGFQGGPKTNTHYVPNLSKKRVAVASGCGELMKCMAQAYIPRREAIWQTWSHIERSSQPVSLTAVISPLQYYNDFGDIIKETLNRTRQMDKMESARTLVQCLQQLYLRLKQEQDRGNTCSSRVQTYSSIKELARRFSLTFGWDQIKSRESLAMIHRDGIEFVFKGFVQQFEKHSPPYISYLTILSEFSSKLLKPDKKTIYSYLQKFAGEQVINNREESWMPLIYYRASLMGTAEGEDAISFISSDTNKQPSLTNRSRSPSVKQVNSEGDQRFLSPYSEPKGNKLLKSSEDSKVQQAPLSKEQLTSSLVSATGPQSSAEVDVDIVDIDV
ncbi:cohesin subunit SA-1-like [Sinocyclocheilus grahami]|uniref:cohesin subunit SA-1-like n=1 Tax=Sinocyclocheilus grahami TaxID=75366 RepID=UPI0007ACAC99|nr:PREDICTED: cohesin subunit SA-1-like [Sinocyclocheilus grahami]